MEDARSSRPRDSLAAARRTTEITRLNQIAPAIRCRQRFCLLMAFPLTHQLETMPLEKMGLNREEIQSSLRGEVYHIRGRPARKNSCAPKIWTIFDAQRGPAVSRPGKRRRRRQANWCGRPAHTSWTGCLFDVKTPPLPPAAERGSMTKPSPSPTNPAAPARRGALSLHRVMRFDRRLNPPLRPPRRSFWLRTT